MLYLRLLVAALFWNIAEHPIAPWIWRQMIEATAWGEQPGFLI